MDDQGTFTVNGFLNCVFFDRNRFANEDKS